MIAQDRAGKTYLTLDGARGVAALFVAIFHTEKFWGPVAFWHSYLAVDLFFVLSGFVIAHAYGRKLRDGRMSSGKFMLVRLIRLYPMYVIATAIAVSLVSFHGRSDTAALWRAIVLAFAFLPASLPGNLYLYPFNHPCWSVFYELVSNLVYVLNRSVLVGRVMVATIVTLGLGVIALALLHDGVAAGVTWRATSIVSASVRACFGLLFGIFIYQHRDWRSHLRVPALAVIAVIAGVFAMPSLGPVNGVFDALCCCLVFPACVLLGARATPGVRLGRAFEFVGRPSYTIYLIHGPVATWVAIALGSQVERYAPFSGVALFALIFALATLFERLLELPVRNWLRDRLERSGGRVRPVRNAHP